MNWARSNTFRAFVVVLMIVFVAIETIQQDWAWVALATALLLLNLVLWREYRRSPEGGTAHPEETDVDATLTELLELPGVRSEWGAGPDVWTQVSYLEDRDGLSLPADEVADYVWVMTQEGASSRDLTHWSVAVGDELKPLLDLDVPEEQDPLVATIARHPSVAEVQHTDREEYQVILRAPLPLDEMAVLAARGLIAHHLDAVRRLVG